MRARGLMLGIMCSSGGLLVASGCSSDAPPAQPPTSAGSASSSAGSGGSGGSAGASPAAGASAVTVAGNGGMTSGGSGSAIAGAGMGGVSGATAGQAGAGAGAGGGTGQTPRGKSSGCGKQNTMDEPGQYSSHDIEVTGVDPYWINERAPHPAQAPYTFTHRSFAIRLPDDYDPNKAYPLVFQGGGCGNTSGTSGEMGAEKLIPDSARSEGIAIGLSYVYPAGGPGACFFDEGAVDGQGNPIDTYEINYWDAVYKQVTENYCVDLEKVFIGGYSSGAWMAYTTSFARAGKVRGMGAGAGGIRERLPKNDNRPFAAMLITGRDDGPNPVHDTKGGTSCSGTEEQGCWNGQIICGFPGATDCFDEGSAHARDEILKRNGCIGSATEPYGQWPDCKKYTGCPAAYPVVYCMPAEGHTKGGDRFLPGIWNFWKSLPPAP